MFWKRKPRKPRMLTGVKATLSAAHRDQTTGQIHGHTWEIVAWFEWRGVDQAVRAHVLKQVVARYDHRCLPDAVAWGERLAERLYHDIGVEYEYGAGRNPCVAVEVNRPSEGIYARFEI